MKLKKIIASIAAAAVAVSAMAVNAFAAITNANSGDNYIYDVLAEGYNVTDVYGVTFTISEYDASAGIGGAIGANSASTGWDQHNWANSGDDVILIGEDNTITYKTDAPVFQESDATDPTNPYAQFFLMLWWGSDVSVDSVVLLGADGNALAAPAGDAAADEGDADAANDENTDAGDAEAADDAGEADDDAGEAAPSGETVSGATGAIAYDGNYFDGTYLYLVSDDGKPQYAVDNSIDVTGIYGVRFTVELDSAEIADDEVWIGGGIGANSNSTGWLQNDWAKGDKLDTDDCTITWQSDAPIFSADDTYVQLWLMPWGGTVNVTGVDILDANGNVITTGGSAAADTTTTAATTTAAPATGNVAVASIAAVMGLAGVAMIASRKRK